jgi:branched-chain amino acid aminotransferase
MSSVWLNGALVSGPLALDRGDRGLLLGDGLFETMLVLNRTPLWGNMHLARLEGAARELGIPFARDRIDDAIATILDGAPDSHQALRITLTRGSGMRGLGTNGGVPTLLLTLDPFDPALILEPVTLATSAVRRSPHAPSCRLKTTSYIDNIVAAREAAARGMGDALLLNTEGNIACTTIANVFLWKGGRIVTPGRDQAILTGVMRQALIAAAAHLGIETEERVVKLHELTEADAVFLTNSLRFIRPVKALDQHPVPQADLGRFADALCEAARLQCGRDPRVDSAPPAD